MSFEVPEFKCTEEAQRYGLFIDRDQYLILEGAKLAYQREFKALRVASEVFYITEATQKRADLAARIQLINEAQEMASDLVRSSLISSDSTIQRFNDSTRRSEAQP